MTDDVQGHCDARFAKVADALGRAIADGEETGAAIAIDIDGETVVDIWGGHADAAKTKPWTADTIVNVWSSTKTVTALAGLVLIDRGLIDPEHARCHLLAGVRRKRQGATSRFAICSPTRPACRGGINPSSSRTSTTGTGQRPLLAAQAPWWEPGTASGYHALTHGHLIGEVLRRVTGKTLKQFVADEIAGPLDADFQIGAAPNDTPRIAEIIPPTDPMEGIPPMDQWTEQMVKTFTGPRAGPYGGQHRRVAGRRHGGGERPHERTGTRPDPVVDLVGRQCRWCSTAPTGDHREDLRGADATDRTWCSRWHPHPVGPRIRLAQCWRPFPTSRRRRSASGAAGVAPGRR